MGFERSFLLYFETVKSNEKSRFLCGIRLLPVVFVFLRLEVKQEPSKWMANVSNASKVWHVLRDQLCSYCWSLGLGRVITASQNFINAFIGCFSQKVHVKLTSFMRTLNHMCDPLCVGPMWRLQLNFPWPKRPVSVTIEFSPWHGGSKATKTSDETFRGHTKECEQSAVPDVLSTGFQAYFEIRLFSQV